MLEAERMVAPVWGDLPAFRRVEMISEEERLAGVGFGVVVFRCKRV